MSLMHFVLARGWLLFGMIAIPIIASAAPPDVAIVRFGQEHVADGIPPVGHPGSAAHHAVDSIVPRTVVIAQGGTVFFELPEGSVHQVLIYEPGTNPKDIDVSIVEAPDPACPFAPLIRDPNGLVAILGNQPCTGGPTEVEFTFPEPGQYLVICAFFPHFVNNDMWARVIVK